MAWEILVALSLNAKPQNLIWASDHSRAVKVIIYSMPLWSLTHTVGNYWLPAALGIWSPEAVSSTDQNLSNNLSSDGLKSVKKKKTLICKTDVLTLHLSLVLTLLFAVIKNNIHCVHLRQPGSTSPQAELSCKQYSNITIRTAEQNIKVYFIQSIMLYLHSVRERYCNFDSISLLLVLKTPEENIWLLLLFGVFLSFFCFFDQKQCGG